VNIGDEEVLPLKEAARRLGLSPVTLRAQAKKGVLRATLVGHTYLVTATELARYERDHRGRHGFADPSHPMHGKQGPGHRRKKEGT
jgi:excisionase family DNA binding protein